MKIRVDRFVKAGKKNWNTVAYSLLAEDESTGKLHVLGTFSSDYADKYDCIHELRKTLDFISTFGDLEEFTRSIQLIDDTNYKDRQLEFKLRDEKK